MIRDPPWIYSYYKFFPLKKKQNMIGSVWNLQRISSILNWKWNKSSTKIIKKNPKKMRVFIFKTNFQFSIPINKWSYFSRTMNSIIPPRMVDRMEIKSSSHSASNSIHSSAYIFCVLFYSMHRRYHAANNYPFTRNLFALLSIVNGMTIAFDLKSKQWCCYIYLIYLLVVFHHFCFNLCKVWYRTAFVCIRDIMIRIPLCVYVNWNFVMKYIHIIGYCFTPNMKENKYLNSLLKYLNSVLHFSMKYSNQTENLKFKLVSVTHKSNRGIAKCDPILQLNKHFISLMKRSA